MSLKKIRFYAGFVRAALAIPILMLAGGPASGENLSLATQTNFNSRTDGVAADDYLGMSVASGDLNNDGIADLVMAAYGTNYNGRNDSGSVYIIYGPVSQSTGTIINLVDTANFNIRYDGRVLNARLGYTALSPYFIYRTICVGDVNNDGKDDLVVGSEGVSELWVIYGPLPAGTGQIKDLATSTNWNVQYTYPTFLGCSCAIGDLNQDGINDLAMGAYGADSYGRSDSGAVYIATGPLPSGTGNVRSLATASNYNLFYGGELLGDYLGSALAIGDLNNDTWPDLVMSSLKAGSGKGYVYIAYSPLPTGSGNQLDLAATDPYNFNVRYSADGVSDYLGSSLAIGDFNNDGAQDLAMTAPTDDTLGLTNNGQSWVVYGPLADGPGSFETLTTASSNWNMRLDGTGNNSYLAAVVAGDFNQDGISDLAASTGGTGIAYISTGPFPAGTGNTLNMALSPSYTQRWSFAATSDSPLALAVGDLNNDGMYDLITGAPGYDPSGLSSAGGVYVTSLAGPRLLSQSSGFTNTLTPAFNWNPVTSAATYRLEIHTDPLFLSPVITKTGIAGTTYTLAGGGETLTNAVAYYARVRAENGANNNFSPVITFTVDTTPPAAPNLVSPADEDTIGTQTPALDWTDVGSGTE